MAEIRHSGLSALLPSLRTRATAHSLPAGAVIGASYLALWAITLAVLAVFTVTAAISEPHPLTFESLVIAFGGVPLFQTLAALMLTAAYGLIRARPWALRMTMLAAYGGAAMLFVAMLVGAHSLSQVLFDGVNVLLLMRVGYYANEPETRAFFANGHECP